MFRVCYLITTLVMFVTASLNVTVFAAETVKEGSSIASAPPHVQLIFAAYSRDPDAVRRLLAAGADVNDQLQAEEAKLLLRAGVERYEGYRAIGWTPLMAVAGANVDELQVGNPRGKHEVREASVRVAALLLDQGADLESKPGVGVTPLFLAAQQGNAPLVKLLIERGAKVNARCSTGFEGLADLTPLHKAIKWPMIVRQLLAAGADPTCRDSTGRTALRYAEALKQTESVTLIRDHIRQTLGQDPSRFEFGGLTAEEEAIEIYIEVAIKTKREAALPDAAALAQSHVPEAESTPRSVVSQLVFASYERSVDDVQRLIAAGADVNGRLGREEIEPLIDAGQFSLLELPLWNWTPLLAVAFSPHDADSDADSDAGVRIAQMLLNHGAKLDAEGWGGTTPLFAAAARGHVSLVRLFLERGADFRRVGRFGLGGAVGQTPLHVAAAWPGVVRLLLDAGADPTRNDSEGWGPLDYAYSSARQESIALMEKDLYERWGRQPAAARSIWESLRDQKTKELQVRAEMEARLAVLRAIDLAEQERRLKEWQAKQDALERQREANPNRPPTLAPPLEEATPQK